MLKESSSKAQRNERTRQSITQVGVSGLKTSGFDRTLVADTRNSCARGTVQLETHSGN